MKINKGEDPARGQTVVNAPPPPQVHGSNEGCCAVPEGAPGPVNMTRMLSIAVIVTHAIALFVYGFYVWTQWIGSLMAIISAGVLLCVYQKGMYTCTPILWIVAAVLDLISAILWFSTSYAWVGIFPCIAMVVTIPGIVYGFLACNGWAIYPPNGTGQPVVTAIPDSRVAYASATVAQLPQHNPPPYGNHV